jgi:Flp pilus assembly pilin Flp
MTLHALSCKREQGEEVFMIKNVEWTRWLRLNVEDERGAGLAEYALLLFVVAVTAATVITAFGADIMAAFTDAGNVLPDGGAEVTTTTVAG